MTTDTGTVEKLNRQGVEQHLSGRLNEAVHTYQQALDLDADNATTHNNIGFLLAQVGKLEEALAHLSQAVTLNPTLANAHANLGQVLAMKGKQDDAIHHLVRATDLQPGNPQNWYNLGRLRLLADNVAGAMNALQHALRIDPNNPHFVRELAKAHSIARDYGAALAGYRQVRRLTPDDVEALTGEGVVLFMQQEYETAIKALSAAVGRQADNAVALRHLGLAQASSGKVNDAVDTFLTLLQHHPDENDARLDLAVLLISMQRQGEALAHLDYLPESSAPLGRVHYYRAMALLEKDPQEAEHLLQQLANSDDAYAEYAREQLELTQPKEDLP